MTRKTGESSRAKEIEAVSLAEELESVLREQQMNGGDDAKND